MSKVRILTLFLLLTPSLFAFSQVYHNEWIDFDKTYFKFQSEETGLHRISYETLVEADISLQGDQFTLFSNGEQIPIYTSTQGIFQEGDFIEFYGQKNDGSLDTELYADSAHQPNIRNSLFSDVRTYYLLNSDLLNSNLVNNELVDGGNIGPLTIQSAANDLTVPLPSPSPYFRHRSTIDITASHHFGKPITPSGYFSFLGEFSEGEGWVGSIVKDGFDQTIKVPTPALYPLAGEKSVLVEMTLVGRNNTIGVVNDQEMEVWINDQLLIKEAFQGFSVENYSFVLRPSELETEADFTGQARTPIVFKGFDGVFANFFAYETKYSVSSLSIQYPRLFDFDGQSQFTFDLDMSNEHYLEITNFEHNDNVILYDLTNHQRMVPQIDNDTLKFYLDSDVNEPKHKLHLSSISDIHFIEILEAKTFVNFSELNHQGNFIIITNDSLRNASIDPIKRYEQYRSSPEGGQHDVTVISINELYEQFAFGIEQHPLAIQGFVNFAVDHWTINPDFLLLLGKSVSYDKARTSPNSRKANLVPSYGQTPSDCMLVSPFDLEDYRPLIATGRLPAQRPQQVHDYIDKLMDYEKQANEASCDIEDRFWKKQVLHIAKGWGEEQTIDFFDRVNGYTDYYTDGPSGMLLANTLTDNFGPPTSGIETPFYPAPLFETAMNNGLAMITYFGHGLTNYWQYAIATNPSTYQNAGKYPYIMSAACSVGDIHKSPGNETMVEEYVLAKESGAIGFSASTALSSVFYIDILSETLTQNLMVNHYGESIAQNIHHSIHDVYNPENIDFKKVSSELVYVGDPAVTLYHWKKPEFLLQQSDWNINDNLAFGAHINASGILYNLGKVEQDSVELALFQETPNGERFLVWNRFLPCPNFADSLNFSIPVQQHFEGNNIFTLKVNPQEQFAEDCYYNNAFQKQIYLESCEPDCPEIPIISEPIDTTANALNEFSSNEHISIFPNPTDGKFTIQLETLFILGITIFNETGQQVLAKPRMRERTIGLDLSPLPNGIYIVEIQTELGMERSQIVLEK